MGEEKSGKSEAIRKGRERARDVDDADAGLNDESVATMSRRASPATDAVGDVKTAYTVSYTHLTLPTSYAV